MKKTKLISTFVIACLLFQTACSNAKNESKSTTLSSEQTTTQTSESTSITEDETPSINPDYEGMSAEEIVATLTIEQKASQMVQGAVYNIGNEQMENNDFGSVLSTYGNVPANTFEEWHDIVFEYQEDCLRSEAGIPFIYGADSVHGVNQADGCVIFPHNINIGAANDPDLTYEMGVCVGSDMLYTGMRWDFAPCVAASQDPRWGRTYESYSSDVNLVEQLAVPFSQGLMSEGILACPKHFMGDGYAQYGTGEASDGVVRLIDRGNSVMTDDEINQNLELYGALVDAGVQTIMISHTSLNGTKMHENQEIIGRLRDEYGFEGIVVSDWNSIHNCSGEDLRANVISAINSGIDMLMEPDDYKDVRDYIVDAASTGEISEERIDDAVTRIIRVKINMGLFEDPYSEDITPTYDYNSDYSHEVALQLAEESLVPLRDDAGTTIPDGSRVFVTGPAADDTGVLCGGWTYTWMGSTDVANGSDFVNGANSILDALKAVADEHDIEIVTDEDQISTCDMVLLCVGEKPYAEWNGDSEDISITGSLALDGNAEAIELAKNSGLTTMTLIVAGRNVIIDNYIDNWDSIIMCYLPGSEGGNAIAAALTGDCEYTGTLPMPYYSSTNDIANDNYWLPIGYSAINE